MPTLHAEYLRSGLSRQHKVLELGPGYAPVLPKAGGWRVCSLDTADGAGLRAKFAAQGLDVSAVEEVDFVWASGALHEAVPAAHHGTFDACVASHVLEHVPDLLGLFRSLAILLRPDGRLLLALPDKRLCFDFFQPTTTTAQVLEAHALGRTRQAPRTVFESLGRTVTAGGAIAWARGGAGALSLIGTLEQASAAMEAASRGEDDRDCHATYFTPASFELLVLELASLGLIDFHLAGTFPPDGCEFYAVLARPARDVPDLPALQERRLELMKRTLLEEREQVDLFLDSPAAVTAEPRRASAEVNDRYVATAPSPQNAVDLVPGWASALPAHVGARAGNVPLFEDPRVAWGLRELGGAFQRTALELGPLEGGHTYMLHQAGAASVTAVEANAAAYLKCLISKELLRLDRARFLLGDAVAWLGADGGRYDLVLASGILYHMRDPVEFLRLVALKGDRLFVWTHYVPDDPAAVTGAWAAAIVGREEVTVGGRAVALYRRAYGDPQNPGFCGGVHSNPAWLRRADILWLLAEQGFTDVRIGFEEPGHPNGPCFALAARR